MIVNSIAWIWYWWQFMVAWYCLVFASIVWFRLPLWKVKTDCWFQSCKALKIDSFAKNNKNNDGHGGLLKAMIIYSEVVLQFAYQEKVTKMVIGGSQLITGWYSEVTMLPLEGAAVAHKDTFFTMDRLIYYYICALIDNRILNPPSPLCSWNIFALHRLLVNFFADLTIDNAKSTQLVYNSGKWLLVCNPWNWV